MSFKNKPTGVQPVGFFVKRQKQNQPKLVLLLYVLEDWMKRSFVSCKYYDTEKLLTKPPRIVTKVLNLAAKFRVCRWGEKITVND